LPQAKPEGGDTVAKSFKPGTDNKPAGEYQETNSRGQPLKNGWQVEIDLGDRLPPTQKAGNRWKKK